jgi:hypothetical protein
VDASTTKISEAQADLLSESFVSKQQSPVVLDIEFLDESVALTRGFTLIALRVASPQHILCTGLELFLVVLSHKPANFTAASSSEYRRSKIASESELS